MTPSPWLTARRAGALACPRCALVMRRPVQGVSCRCPRCGAALAARRPRSLARTWAFLLAAAVLYLPANLLPIMNTRTLVADRHDTILVGVVFLWNEGTPHLAAIVFLASIVVPLVKMGALAYLAWTVQRGSIRGPQERLGVYRLVEAVGRWSMLDVFVVALMAALVRMGVMANVTAGPGAAAFGAVVVLTMFAALSFDPRLIWDAKDDEQY